MARSQRATHGDVFAPQADFNEQLYLALRQSPWWMTSLAIHVMVFFVLTLFDTSDVQAAPEEAAKISVSDPFEAPDIDPTDDHTDDPVPPQEFVSATPHIEPEAEHPDPESENDLPHEDTFGKESDALANATHDGPTVNAHVGIGPGAGGFRGGLGGNRPGGSSSSGPPPAFEDALDEALRWLAAHQSPNGGWEAAGFDRWCDGVPIADPARRPQGLGKALYDPGVTGLALCAFLGAGFTNRGKHPYAKVVSRGLRYLKNVQDPEGCFGPRAAQQYIYNHAIATLAMVEAYGMTGSPIWKGSAQRALDFTALTRNPYFAWRYGVKPGDNDSSVTGWMMMALKSAKLINEDMQKRGKPAALLIDEAAFEGIRSWIDKMTDPDYGRVGYINRGSGPARPQELVDRFPGNKSESMTAVGVLARVFLGEDPRKSRPVKLGAALCSKLPPVWNPTNGSIDMYYWYYGTLAMFQVGGAHWRRWRNAMDRAIVASQRTDTDYCQYRGSWDPIGPWGLDGGRVYSTAVMAMCLQIYFRYPRVFGTR